MLILVPQSTWQRIATSQWNSLVIFLVSFLPLLLVTAAAEAFGMIRLGAHFNDYGRLIEVNQQQAIYFQGIQLALTGLILILGTKLVLWVCDGFHSPTTFRQAFTVTAYAITPLLWARLPNAIPQIPSWVCFAVGATGIVVVLYHGIALVLEPDTSVGFGLYLVCSLVLVLSAGLAHFVLQIVAERKLNIASLPTETLLASVGTLL